MRLLKELTQDLWEHSDWIRVLGIRLPRRMVVVRLPGGDLWVWSPNRLDPKLAEELATLGPVAHLVSPSRMHRAHLAQWRHSYPRAALWGAPALSGDLPELQFDGELSEAPPEAWEGAFELAALKGIPSANEVALLHRASGTAILCDLVFHIGPSAPFTTRLAMRLNGGLGPPRPTRVFRTLIQDPNALRASAAPILAWPFERLLMAHGDGLERGGRQALCEALASL